MGSEALAMAGAIFPNLARGTGQKNPEEATLLEGQDKSLVRQFKVSD